MERINLDRLMGRQPLDKKQRDEHKGHMKYEARDKTVYQVGKQLSKFSKFVKI